MGSAKTYSKFLANDVAYPDELGPQEVRFIAERDGFYQASVSQTGWPYVQFRGGPTGFLKVLSSQTLGYADFLGNRQYISTGNLSGNDRLSMILMDYPNRRRLKIWGRARLIEGADNPEVLGQFHDQSYPARPERAVLITVEAFCAVSQIHLSVSVRTYQFSFMRQLLIYRDEGVESNALNA